MKIKRISCLIALSTMLHAYTQAFGDDAIINKRDSLPHRTESIYLHIPANLFFKNNEYFQPHYKGYTLTGSRLRPQFLYSVSSKTTMAAGIHLLHFSGEASFNQVLPLFHIRHELLPGMNLQMGTLKGSLNHQLIEPLYRKDRYYFDETEYGVQFLINKNWVESDIWIDWKNFIEWGDTEQEHFIFGTSSIFHLFKIHGFQISLPLQTITEHYGGQINSSDNPVKTESIISPGISFQLMTKAQKKITLENHFPLSTGGQMPFRGGGTGILSKIHVHTPTYSLSAGYWNSHRFHSPQGEPLYFNTSNQIKEIITGKIELHQQTGPVRFGLRGQVFHHLKTGKTDYNYLLFLLLDELFFLGSA